MKRIVLAVSLLLGCADLAGEDHGGRGGSAPEPVRVECSQASCNSTDENFSECETELRSMAQRTCDQEFGPGTVFIEKEFFSNATTDFGAMHRVERWVCSRGAPDTRAPTLYCLLYPEP